MISEVVMPCSVITTTVFENLEKGGSPDVSTTKKPQNKKRLKNWGHEVKTSIYEGTLYFL